ncbi:alpha/beta hydrolase, partial [Aeromicrobium sp.]|uniref:alpha/beta hydrolase n=1 Tax=Aeromicrobium sp. TaxID=1871063 RepID=UPI003D6B8DE4
GFGCTKDSGLEPFAERFAATGADVVVFDYRGFGMSEGEQRQFVDHRRHREDYQAAVAHARALPGIDTDRIVLWGTSYSGGHVIAVAADDPLIAGVISQGAAMDGLVALLEIWNYAGPRQLMRLTAHAMLDVVFGLFRLRPHMIPIVGAPDALAAITSDDGLPGYSAIVGPTFRNEMAARGILSIVLNRPVTSARQLRMPVLLVVASHDSIAPPAAVEKVAKRVRGRLRVERFDVGHFDLYLGDPFEESLTAQVEFVRSI